MSSIVISDPAIVSVAEQVRQGALPLKELKNKVGRYKTEKAIKKSVTFADKLKDYLNDPLKHELAPIKKDFEIFKRFFCKHNGQEKVHVDIGDNIEIGKICKDFVEIRIRE